MCLKGEVVNEREDAARGPLRARKKAGRPKDLATEAITSVAECVGIPFLRRTVFNDGLSEDVFLGLGGGGTLNRIGTWASTSSRTTDSQLTLFSIVFFYSDLFILLYLLRLACIWGYNMLRLERGGG